MLMETLMPRSSNMPGNTLQKDPLLVPNSYPATDLNDADLLDGDVAVPIEARTRP
jgi:hypothetical protein